MGRQDLLREFEVALGRTLAGRPGKSLMPIGLRGVGKTVLLNCFVDIAARQKCRVAYIEASEAGNFTQILAAQLRKVLGELDRLGAASAALKKAIGTWRSFSLSVSPEGATSLSFGGDALRGAADSGVLSEDITDVFLAVGEAASERVTCVVIAVDEVQYLDEEEFGAIITAIHRTTQLQLPLLFVGTGLPVIPMLAGNAKSYAERLFHFPRIGSLSIPDIRAAIQGPAEAMGVAFNAEALDAIVEATKGYPYFIQEWAYEAWNLAECSPISIEAIRIAEPIVQEKLDKTFFSVRFDRLTPTEKRYLRAMSALGPGPHRSGDIAARLGSAVASVAPLRFGLIKKGMIYSPAHGDTAFTVPLFDEFMRRAIPEEM